MANLTEQRFNAFETTITAARLNKMLEATVRGELSNTETLTANKTLVDADFALQVYTPTAAREVTLPAVAAANHPFYIANASATYALTVNNAGGTTIAVVAALAAGTFMSNAVGWYTLSLPLRQVGGEVQIGTAANYSAFEADGTYRAVGTATVYEDIFLPISPKTTGVGSPNLATFLGNIRKFTFAVGDLCEIDTAELLHKWKEGSPIELHVHWATNTLNNATVRGVKWEMDYTWANMESAGGTIIFPDVTTPSVESVIAANEAAKTHKYTSIVSFTPSGGKIGAALLLSLKRIASVTNIAPAADPFVLMVGAHIECDTLGSRTTAGK
jgi:hypothetical protein